MVIDVTGAPPSSGLAARLLTLQPFSWSGRGGALPYLLTAFGVIALVFGILALAGGTSNDLTPGWALLIAIGGAYHLAVGGFAIREHLTCTDEEGQRFAWSNAAAYALCVPAFAVGALFLIGDGLRPFPPKSSVISGQVERFWADQVSASDVVYRLKLRGDDQGFAYDCEHGSKSGWCSAHDALQAASERPAARADVIAADGKIAGLGLDGQNLVSWETERLWGRTAPLLFGIMTALVAMGFTYDATGWLKRARSGRAAEAASPKIIE